MTVDEEKGMPEDDAYDWLAHCPGPRPRPADIEWDVFISYRSVNRPWVLALYDTLVQAGFRVFLDQYELVPGESLDESLERNLQVSGAGVLVWSEKSESRWVKREHEAMRVLEDGRDGTDLPFTKVLAKLDSVSLPLFLASSLYVDFSSYPEGPRGGELLRLMHGLVGKPLPAEAVRAITRLDAETKTAMNKLRAAIDNEFPEDIVNAARDGGDVWYATPMLASQAAEGLNAIREYDRALDVIDLYKGRFDRSIRLAHMEALAYRRTGRYRDALRILGELYADGHRDPETLGLYGASLAKRHEESGERGHLMKSQRMYADAFALNPSDFFTGVNAASKAALLGLGPEVFQPIARQVAELPAVREPDPANYWALATVGEVRLLLLDIDGAVEAYREAVSRHAGLRGNIDSTREQLDKLLAVLDVVADDKERLRGTFAS